MATARSGTEIPAGCSPWPASSSSAPSRYWPVRSPGARPIGGETKLQSGVLSPLQLVQCLARRQGAFLRCRISNPGGDDLQNQRLASIDGQPLLSEHVARLAQGPWNLNGQPGLVVGATYPVEIERVRSVAPTLPLLIPGVGAQGGDAVATVKAGWRAGASIIVNSSRAILYASSGEDFAEAARREAVRTRNVLEAARLEV